METDRTHQERQKLQESLSGQDAATQQRAEQAEAQILLLQREGQVHDSNSNSTSNPPAIVEH